MNRRIEQRFQVYSPAKVVLLDDPERELDCLLTDISGMGLRLLATEALPRDTMIAVELEDHVVLCDVRNSEARGDRFAVGAEKIHTLSKLDVAPDLKPVEKIKALVADFHRRLRSELETAKPAAFTAPESKLEPEPLEKSAPVPVPVVEETSLIPGPAPCWTGLEPRITDSPQFIPPQARLALPGPPRAGMTQFASVLAESSKAETPKIEVRSPDPEPSPATQGVVAQEVEPPAVPVLAGPEPEPPVDHALPYRVPVTPFQRRLLRTWSIVIGLIAGLVMLGAEELLYRPFRVNAQAIPAAHATPPTQPAPEVSLPVAPLEKAELPVPAPLSRRHASLTVSSNTWLTACIDGAMVISTLLVPNETRAIDFEKIAWLRLGNAGGVQLSLDGKPMGPVGDPGMVRDVELSADGLKFEAPLAGSGHCRSAQIAPQVAER